MTARDREPRGRPRDERIDRDVLRATAELVAEVGYNDLNLTTIAQRAGTSKPAMRRRWPTKAHLVHEAVFDDAELLPIREPSGGRLEDVIRALVVGAVDVFRAESVRRATPGLLDAMATDRGLHDALHQRIQASFLAHLDERLREAVATGEARPGVDAKVVTDLIAGSVAVSSLLRGADAIDDSWCEAVSSILIAGLRA